MNTLQELWAIFVALWNTGNRIARAAILLIVLWPVLVAVTALVGFPTITSIVALTPVMAIAFSIIAAIDPIVIAVIATFKKGRTIFTWIATIIAAELVLGVYFSIVPVWNDRGLVPVVVLIAVTMFFLAIGIKGKIQKTAISAMIFIIIVLTAIFFLGGREKAAAKFESAPTKTSTTTTPAMPDYQLCAINGEYDFSNLDIKKVGKVEIAFQRDCWTRVVLPVNTCWRITPSADVWMLWADGTKFIDGPGRIVPGINGKRLFNIRGVSQSGALPIFFEKQT